MPTQVDLLCGAYSCLVSVSACYRSPVYRVARASLVNPLAEPWLALVTSLACTYHVSHGWVKVSVSVCLSVCSPVCLSLIRLGLPKLYFNSYFKLIVLDWGALSNLCRAS